MITKLGLYNFLMTDKKRPMLCVMHGLAKQKKRGEPWGRNKDSCPRGGLFFSGGLDFPVSNFSCFINFFPSGDHAGDMTEKGVTRGGHIYMNNEEVE